MTMEPRQSDLERERASIQRSARWGRRVAGALVVAAVAVFVYAAARGRWEAAAVATVAVAVGLIAFALFGVARGAVE
jgi:preprotein translocase subunit SecF